MEPILQSLSQRLSDAQLAPAYFTALLALALAAVLLAVNHRRPTHQAWALLLVFVAVWQGSIGLAQLSSRTVFLRVAFASGAGLYWALLLVIESALAPWASLRRNLWRIRHWAWTAALGAIPFTQAFLPATSSNQHRVRTPLFWAMELFAIGWCGFALARSLRLVRSQQVPSETRRDLTAFIWLVAVGPLVQLPLNLLGAILGVRSIGWLAPLAMMAALLIAGSIILREAAPADPESRPFPWRFAARIVLYAALALAVVGFVRLFGEAGTSGAVFATAVLAAVLAVQPVIDRMLRGWMDRRPVSPNFAGAQMAISVLTESGFDLAELHRGYCAILKQWCGGAREVYLSDGTFAAVWPTEPIPLRILERLTQQRALTPEHLEADRPAWSQELAYLIRQHIGALVSVGAAPGGRLVAAFAARRGQGPFGERELAEASQLLAGMLTGTQLVRLRQRLRGQDRLNFYAQYAPQFAHELRNGLYLQTQLMRAIAAGRGQDVLPADAQAGLESVAQIDRLCDHFFNVGALYNRPIERLDLWDLLETMVTKLRREFDGGPEILLRLGFDLHEQAEIMGNAELLTMALHNLVKNAVEAAGTDGNCPRLELAASRQLDKVHLLVRDNGSGLPEDRRLDAFAPGKSHKRTGMGLGLSIARDCVEAMGGAVGLRYSGPSGTCFEITLVGAEQIVGVSAPCDFLLPPE